MNQTLHEIIQEKLTQNLIHPNLKKSLEECNTILKKQEEKTLSSKSSINLEISNPKSIKYILNKTNQYEIKSGLISSLVQLLCLEEYYDEDEARAIIFGYSFVNCSHLEFLDYIDSQLKLQYLDFENNVIEKFQPLAIIGLLQLLISWKKSELGKIIFIIIIIVFVL